MKYDHKLAFVFLIALLLFSPGCGKAPGAPVTEAESLKQTTETEQTATSETAEIAETTEIAVTSEETEPTEASATTESVPATTEIATEIKEIVLSRSSLRIEEIPEYNEEPYVEIYGNQPEFSEDEKACLDPFEEYSELDSLGRCGAAYANVCPELQPTEERGPVGQIQPSGWHTVKYNELIDGNYLYNRCHLIGYQLAGENSNECNLITGTRYLNMGSMLTFENMVCSYLAATGNHVLYRVTPVFEGDNLVASGVQMEGWSVEDAGKGICFNVFCYNVQPGIEIDYETGDSREDLQAIGVLALEAEEIQSEDALTRQIPESAAVESEIEIVEDPISEDQVARFILNTNSKKIHLPSCSSVDDMADRNKQEYTGTISELRERHYQPCQRCLKRFPKEKPE